MAGKTGDEAVTILAQGYGELEPFTIPPQTYNRIARELIDRRRTFADDEPTAALDALIREGLKLAQQQLERLRRREKAGKLKSREIADYARAIAALRPEVAKLPQVNGQALSKVADSDFLRSLADPEASTNQSGDQAPDPASVGERRPLDPDEPEAASSSELGLASPAQ